LSCFETYHDCNRIKAPATGCICSKQEGDVIIQNISLKFHRKEKDWEPWRCFKQVCGEIRDGKVDRNYVVQGSVQFSGVIELSVAIKG
jgi:hypothetical protein